MEALSGPARFLAPVPNLEVLDLRLFRTMEGDAGAASTYAQLLARIPNKVRLPSLQKRWLRGVKATEEGLLGFGGITPGSSTCSGKEST